MDIERQKHHMVESSHSEPIEDGLEMRNFSQLGGTEADEQEMRMLGRTQQLNVCTDFQQRHARRGFIIDKMIAKLPVHLNPRICLHINEYVGDCIDVSQLPSTDI